MILLHLKKSYVMENFCFLLGSSVIAKQQQEKCKHCYKTFTCTVSHNFTNIIVNGIFLQVKNKQN